MNCYSAIKRSKLLGVVVHTVTPALRRMREGDHEFESFVGYIVRPVLKGGGQVIDSCHTMVNFKWILLSEEVSRFCVI
jgi:hypothetical protein